MQSIVCMYACMYACNGSIQGFLAANCGMLFYKLTILQGF